MKKTIGTVTTYRGNEHRYLRGHQVRIVAVIKNAARPDYDPDADDGYITDDDDLARLGGVTAGDRIEVQPWIARSRAASASSPAIPARSTSRASRTSSRWEASHEPHPRRALDVSV